MRAINETDEYKIRAAYALDILTQKQIADVFGISQQRVSAIIWKNAETRSGSIVFRKKRR